MKYLKTISACVLAAVLTFAFVGCGCSGIAGGESTWQKVAIDDQNLEPTTKVQVKKGEALFVLANFEKNDGEAIVTVKAENGETFSDSYYDGYGVAETEVEPGTYTAEIKAPKGAKGTVWLVSRKTDDIDFAKMNTQEVVEKVTKELK